MYLRISWLAERSTFDVMEPMYLAPCPLYSNRFRAMDQSGSALRNGYYGAKTLALEKLREVEIALRVTPLQPRCQAGLVHAEEILAGELVDIDASHVVGALIRIETAAAAAAAAAAAVDRRPEQLLTTAAHRARDLVAWRLQVEVPLGHRQYFVDAAHRAWGGVAPPIAIEKLLHAHRKKVARMLPGCFLSRTQRQAVSRGKVRAKRAPRKMSSSSSSAQE